MSIKTKISKVYAKAKDRNYTHIYKDGRRFDSALNLDRKIIHYSSGNSTLKNTAKYSLNLYSRDERQVPEKSYETMRLYLLKRFNTTFTAITKDDYSLRFNKYPHQILRFHAIASGARADRLSQGMRRSFGKPFMRAAKINEEDLFLEVKLSPKYDTLENYEKLKVNLHSSRCKMPFRGYYKIIKSKIDIKVKVPLQ